MTSKIDSEYIRKQAKRIKAINILGGKCKKCGEDRHWLLDFHHIRDKEKPISKMKYYRWSMMKKEILKCELLCANCHGEIHTGKGKNHDPTERY